ncbi:hypothetical protein [Catelliglobosispora koreensis]|uniref:hypothetical protein n=1 Tax=Catelliglobosispora koreensis TaxID=129052 RepID=UPI00035C0ABB|nr:hypothetical protein [Catelliglobosispora koreensis]
MENTEQRLSRLRGGGDPEAHNARTIAAMTRNPGCVRRAIMDAAGVDKPAVAAAVGHPTSIGRLSDFAVSRGISFETRVKSEGCAELLRLLREQLGLPVPQAHYEDLGSTGKGETVSGRYLRSKAMLDTAEQGTGTLFDHPLLRLSISGVWAYLEPDLVAFQLGEKFYVIEIKSFPVIDGVADASKVAASVTQSAVYVLALQSLLSEAGRDPGLVSHEVILVCPKDFSNQATATLVDVRKPLAALRRQLSRMDNIAALLHLLPANVTFDPELPAMELAQALTQASARYSPECLAACEMGSFCRAEAKGSTAILGRTVREDLGGVDAVSTALELATGRLQPTKDLLQAAHVLRLAQRMRTEALAR